MKRTLLIVVMAVVCHMAFAQTALFKKYDNAKGVSTVYISKALLGMMPKMNVGNKDISKIAGKLDRVQVLSCERPSLMPTIKAEALAYFKNNGYTNMMAVNDNGENTIIYYKAVGKNKNEFVLLSSDKSEVNIINIMGAVTLKDIKQIAQ